MSHAVLACLSSFFFICTAVFSLAQSPAHPYRHADPPLDDPHLIERFGRSWSEPITNGYLIVGNTYIDAPYIVEQRGYMIFVNNVQVAYGTDPRDVLPLPPDPVVTEDPGVPTNLTVASSAVDALVHAVTQRKMEYWWSVPLKGQAYTDAFKAYMLALPCVVSVDPMPEDGPVTYRITDHAGEYVIVELALGKPPPRKAPSDEVNLERVRQCWSSYANALRADLCVRSHGIGYPATTLRVGVQRSWQELFHLLEGAGTALNKANSILKLGLFQRTADPVRTLDGFLPLDEFHATDQIHQRARGDHSWTNGVPAYLASMTNGWQPIPPAWEREEEEIPKHPSTQSPKVMEGPGEAAPPTEKHAPEKTTPSTSPPLPLLPLATGAALAIVAIAFILSRRRKP